MLVGLRVKQNFSMAMTPDEISLKYQALDCASLVPQYVFVCFASPMTNLFTYSNLVLVNFLLFKWAFFPSSPSFVPVNRVEMGSNLISDVVQVNWI